MENKIRFSSNEVQFLSLELLYLEHLAFNKEIRRAYHSHWFWQAEMVLAGTVIVHLTNQEIIIKKGDILIYSWYIRHACEYQNDYTEYISFKFSCTGAEIVKNPHVYGFSHGTEYLYNYMLSILQDFDTNRRLIAVHIQNSLKTFLELGNCIRHQLTPKIISRSCSGFPQAFSRIISQCF